MFAMTSVFSWQNSLSLCLASFGTPRPNLPVTPGISLFPSAFQAPNVKSSSFFFFFFGANPRTSCRSSWNHSTSYVSSLVFGAWIWISVILNGLPWKQAEMILSLLKLYPSNAFQILLFTTRATPLLLMDPSPHVWLFVTLETVVHQAPPSMRFSRQEIWYG